MAVHAKGWYIKDQDDLPSNDSRQDDFYDVLETRLSRRGLLKGLGAAAASTMLPLAFFNAEKVAAASLSTLGFEELAHGLDQRLHVAAGYEHQVLLRWGDPLFVNSPEFNPNKQTALSQSLQFGYNNDYVGFLPLTLGSNNSEHGLLIVNHEYTSARLMFPGSPKAEQLTKQQLEIEMMAHGLSVVEIKRKNSGAWQVLRDSKYNRRITAKTEMQITGPAAGHKRLKTAMSADAVKTWGTYGNCAGGMTPWGTVLTAEENIQGYFSGDPSKTAEADNYKRFGLNGKARYHWHKIDRRFDLKHSPNEALHAGWIVEIDPHDPDSTPKKRTALGRLKHEGCNVWINPDQRVVAYTGDDQRFEYIYKFVSRHKYQANKRKANMQLLDDGTLYVAEFTDTGRVIWHPLVHGKNGLTEKNGFHSQADVCLDTRKAADLVGATPMDRPEDIEVNPKTGTVFAMLTNNSKRKPNFLNGANPRHNNLYGHIIEMKAPKGDHAAAVFNWEFFIFAGDPNQPLHGAQYHEATSKNGWFANPDNCAFDNMGRLWIATDGAYKQGVADGVWACDVEGEGRALSRHFLRTPTEAELCGPCFTPDNRSFFAAVQHPAERSTFDKPSTRWPDFDAKLPPRPSVIAVYKNNKGIIGS